MSTVEEELSTVRTGLEQPVQHLRDLRQSHAGDGDGDLVTQKYKHVQSGPKQNLGLMQSIDLVSFS